MPPFPCARYRLLLLCLCAFGAFNRLPAQGRYIHGVVVAQSSGARIGLASLSWKKKGGGGVTDSTGHFRLFRGNLPDTLVISHVGFLTVSIPVDLRDTGGLTIALPEKEADEVVVMAKYNRGLLWWKKIVQYKSANDPPQFHSFSSDLYRKMELDLNNVTRQGLRQMRLLKPFAFIADNIDTASGSSPFLPVFMQESLSRYYSSPHPRKQREEVTAIRTSGLKDEGVLHLIDGIRQSVDVYENFITLFGKEFVSPLSNAGNAHYIYRGADTQYIDGQRYLHLFFSPKHPGDNVFAGDCWIHQATWAISGIDLDISSTANINFVHRLNIRQEFVRQTDGAWILSRDQVTAEISPLRREKLSIITRQTSIYQQVQIEGPGVAVALKQNEPTVYSADARSQPAAYWDSHRPEPLSDNERKVYKLADTLQQMPLFQHYVRTAKFIIHGRKEFGKVEIGPWYKWVSGNQHEKLRLRFDLATTDKFSKQLRLHGYLAYGTADRQLKGQLDGRYVFPGSGGYSVQASYWHDLDNGGARHADDGVAMDNLFSQIIRRPGIRQKFVMVDEVRTAVTREWSDAFSTQVYISRANYSTFNPLPPVKTIAGPDGKDIVNTEAGLNLRYGLVTRRKDQRPSGDHPVFQLGYAAGLPVLGDYRYQKVNAVVNQNIHLPGWGQIHYQVYGGKIWGGPLPFMLLQIHPGNETYYYSRQAFNLMSRYEYVSDRWAGFTFEHDFDKKLLNLLPLLRRINVRQFWNVKAVWGNLCTTNKQLNHWEYGNYRMKSLNGKPYIELGTGLDDIFTYFRVDMVWRFAPTRPASGGMAIPVQPNLTNDFGVFGSFHLQF